MPPPTGSSGAFAAMSLACGTPGNGRRGRIVAAITPGMPDAERLADDLDALAPFSGCKVLEFPPPIEGDKAALGCRLKTLSAISEWKMAPESLVISLPCAAVAGRIPAADSVGKTRFAAGSISFSGAKECLSRLGYTRVAAVSAQGEWASRGGIVDFWSPVEDFPVRAEFFGEDLESLRSFDPATQLSTGALVSADASAAMERDGDGSTFFDMLPEDAIVLAIGYGSYEFDPGGRFTVYAGGAAPQGTETIGFETSPLPGFAELGAAEARHPELFDAARKRLEAHLRSARARGCIVAEAKDLSGGFEMPGLAVVSKADRVFTKRRPRRDKRTGGGARLGDFADLEPGEYVVHANHGVGRYIGSSEITVDGRRTEAYTIEYAEGAKLLVPAAHAHLLTKYVGVAGAEVELHRLDGKKWSKDKSAAEKAVHDLASALLETQARRATVPGFAYDVKCEGVEAFEAAFPYVETEDQMKAIDDVKRDLASTRPMDRLVCGDAGYGKTEVAIRAAYIAAMNGKQTVVLAPTTVLAEQHFETFVSRFDGTPVRVEAISRLQTKGARNGTLERIASGACDIVVGTHAILSGKVRFKDLGLVVIDEEQRFGVRHKEFLKRLKATADVLTLSATPIPRTLYMSMTGTRDLSILRTPPSERVAVETIVTRESDELVKASIERELARGGQVFYLHNRISTIWDVEKRLSKLCPGVKIAVAHGRMDAAELAGRMRAFQRGECDILLSTTIVESGIDIPTANTIIVDRADTFGLADLYQLRGRVGRSSKQGRAVLLLPPHGLVDAEARERMDALRRHGGLGAGFDLAVRDLELRGSGNLLGTQQSGHIAAIGFVLYCKLLKRTIAALKGEKPKETAVVTLNLDFAGPFYSKEDDPSSARIPYEYVEDDSARMDILRRIAEAETKKDVSVLSKELSDRFGKPPPAAKRLLSLAVLKTACAAAGISRVDAKDGKAVFRDAATGNIKAVAELRKSSSDKMIAELTRFAERLSDGDAQKAK
jgi:transcription-repair coupling factor (superfamily II helicase)